MSIPLLQAVFVVGIPACVVGGVAYSYTSGKSVMDVFIAAYGALYKVPGRPRSPVVILEAEPCSCCCFQVHCSVPAAALRRLCLIS